MAAALCLSVVVALSVSSVSSDLLVGAPERDNPSDPDVIKAAAFAVNGFNQQSSEDYIYKLVKIVSAETQIVAGVRYILNIEIGKTQCKKSESNAHSCTFIQDSKLAKTLLCTFSVLEVPWENFESLESSSCKTQ